MFVPRCQSDTYGNGAQGDNTINSYRPSRPGADRYLEKFGERTRVKRKGLHGIVTAVDEKDMDSKWIHRDKLAQIERRELAEMGLRLSRSSRRGSKIGQKPSKILVESADLWEDTVEGQEEVQLDVDLEQVRSRRMSTDNVAEDVPNHNPIGQDEWLTRQMVRPNYSGGYASRPSTSRIPVYKSNSVVETGSQVEKHSRVHRSRKDSLGWASLNDKSGNHMVGGETGITGSQSLLDAAADAEGPDLTDRTSARPDHHSQTPRQSLEQRTRGSSGRWTPPNSGVRKVSGARGPSDARQRTTAATGVDSPRRPTTSGDSRPATARPEGEAPWIATMYKPDPRLPPEEQMLPTHAKRLALEQQEHDSKPASPNRPKQGSEFTPYNSEDSGEQAENRDQPDEDLPEFEKISNYKILDQSESHRDPVRTREDFQRSSRNINTLQTSDYGRNVQHSEKRQSGQWPLKTPTLSAHSVRPFSNSGSDAGSSRNGRISANGHEHGGYSVMPTIQTQVEMEQRLSLRPGVPQDRLSTANSQHIPPQTERTRILDMPEPEKNDKTGCAKCCIVM